MSSSRNLSNFSLGLWNKKEIEKWTKELRKFKITDRQAQDIVEKVIKYIFKLIRKNIWNPRCAKIQELEKNLGIRKKDKRGKRATKKRNGKKHKEGTEQKPRQDSDQESEVEQEESNTESDLETEQELEPENNEDYGKYIQDQEKSNQVQESQNQNNQDQEISEKRNVREIGKESSRIKRVKEIVWDWIKEKRRWLGL